MRIQLEELMTRFPDAAVARAHLESLRWPEGVICPGCRGLNTSTRLRREAADRGLWTCRRCTRQFTVTVDSVMEDSHVPLHKWLIIIYLCASNKRVSAMLVSRALRIGYKSAWRIMKSLRQGVRVSHGKPLSARAWIPLGSVEIDHE